MADSNQKPHAIMISFPLQGHITPFVNLAMNLASKGFTITFVHTEKTHHLITTAARTHHTTTTESDIFTKARNAGLDIRYTTVSDGLPLDFDRFLNRDKFWDSILHIFPSHVDELVAKIVQSDQSSPTCLISDTFYVWPSTIAKKYNLVYVSFWTQPALVFSLYYHLDLLMKNGHFTSGQRKATIDYVPGVQLIQTKDLMSHLQVNDILTLVPLMSYKAFEQVKINADFVLCNTVQELEFETISALNEKQPVYPIGPIFPTSFTNRTVATSLWSESDCTQWLNTKPHGSVLYVSFGSYAHTSKHDIVEIAHGLSLSKVNFIWVLRPDIIGSDNSDFLPVGFEDDVKDRGLIVQWCYQTDVLSHLAIGGFLTHCGWNSILESIWCSVPFICFPLSSDQFTNRKLVVDDWKIGINLCDMKSVTRDEASDNIKRLMSGKISDELRKEAKKVRKTMENALATNGSSERNFNQFMKDVKAKIQKRNGWTCHET